jgi:hypothetical protein
MDWLYGNLGNGIGWGVISVLTCNNLLGYSQLDKDTLIRNNISHQ